MNEIHGIGLTSSIGINGILTSLEKSMTRIMTFGLRQALIPIRRNMGHALLFAGFYSGWINRSLGIC